MNVKSSRAPGSAQREAILVAATAAFLRYGFKKTSMDDVALNRVGGAGMERRPVHPCRRRGIRRRVKFADGPERIFGEWWKRDAELSAVRDYFRVEDEAGERFWIYRSGDGEDTATGSHLWFLHGIFG